MGYTAYSLLFSSGKVKHTDVLVLGHAGSGFLSPLFPFNPLPANSMASIVKAMEEHGADGVEVDVQLTRDGVPVLYHDLTLETLTDKRGLIDTMKAEEVVGVQFKGGFFYDLFHGEQVVTLEAVLQRFQKYPELPHLHLDLRNQDPARHASYAQTLMALLRKYNYPLERLVFISPNPDFLEAFRQVEPQAYLMIDSGGDFAQALETAKARSFWGVCTNGKSVTAAEVQTANAQGLQVVLFGGKSRSSISKMISLEPFAIQVNNVQAMREMVGESE